jgi:hypothetical protein
MLVCTFVSFSLLLVLFLALILVLAITIIEAVWDVGREIRSWRAPVIIKTQGHLRFGTLQQSKNDVRPPRVVRLTDTKTECEIWRQFLRNCESWRKFRRSYYYLYFIRVVFTQATTISWDFIGCENFWLGISRMERLFGYTLLRWVFNLSMRLELKFQLLSMTKGF